MSYGSIIIKTSDFICYELRLLEPIMRLSSDDAQLRLTNVDISRVSFSGPCSVSYGSISSLRQGVLVTSSFIEAMNISTSTLWPHPMAWTYGTAHNPQYMLTMGNTFVVTRFGREVFEYYSA